MVFKSTHFWARTRNMLFLGLKDVDTVYSCLFALERQPKYVKENDGARFSSSSVQRCLPITSSGTIGLLWLSYSLSNHVPTS